MPEAELVRVGPPDPPLEAAAQARFGITEGRSRKPNELLRPGAFVKAAKRRTPLVVLTSPRPERSCGWGLLLLWLIFARPARIAFADGSGGWIVQTRARFLAATAGEGALQWFGLPVIWALHLGLCAIAVFGRKVRQVSRPGRVAYLRTACGYLHAEGGAATHGRSVVSAMRRSGVTVDLFQAALGSSDIGDWGEGNSWGVPRVGRLMPALAAMAGDVVLVFRIGFSGRRYDALYHRSTPCSAAGAIVSALWRRPLILEFNSGVEQNGAQPLVGAYERWVESLNLAAASRIVVVSTVLRDYLQSRGVPTGKIVVVPNGVDPDRFGGGGEQERERLGIPPKALVFGFVGTFGFWHGAPALASAFVKVSEEVPEAVLLLVGDGPERKQTEAVLTEAGLSARVFLPGPVEATRIPPLLDACDVLCSPHQPWPGGLPFHGSPTKLFEYMAAGKPIVASSLGQIGEVLRDEDTALLVQPGDQEELVAAMVRIAHDPELREKLGSRSARVARQSHTWDVRVEQVLGGSGRSA